MEPSRHGGLWFGRSLLVPENQPEPTHVPEVAEIKDMVLAPRLAEGVPEARGGAVTVIQRCSSDMKLNPHLHVILVDGLC